MCVKIDSVTAPSLTCPPQRCLGTPLPGFLCREERRHPQTPPQTPLLPLNTFSTSMATCRGRVKKNPLLRSVPHITTERIFSFSPHSHLSFSLPSSSFSAGTCNYLMPGRQVLSRGVRTGASWQLGMIRRILEFCHWSHWCSPQWLGCLVVTATIAALNLLTGRNSSSLWNPNNMPSWG